ncbi:MAG TPA: inorganic phosphate transporter [Candidatus Dormibacteraeota bacterium]|nr:inorganic phosphate transporter [Candidatus Dormibacteraeota bacterium]
MNFPLILVAIAGAFIAYINGANDVSKGIATLVGSGVTDYRRAILWGTVCTGAGTFFGALVAQAMVETFGGGFLSKGIAPTFAAALAMILGAAACVTLATRTSMPVSTTHAIVGSIAGVAVIAHGIGGFQWAAVTDRIALPLLLSPVLALAIASVAIRILRKVQGRFAQRATCLCAEYEPAPALIAVGRQETALQMASLPQVRLVTGSVESCNARQPFSLRLTTAHMHWLSSGATSFSRGMNDAPKMVALVLVASMLRSGAALRTPAFLIVGLGIMAGSWLAGRRITSVLAEKITPMSDWEGLIANVVTTLLVAPGAMLGLPMSTTHVSTGSIMGIGLHRKMNWRTVREMVLAWVVTLPVAGMLGAMIYLGLRLLHT